MANLNALYGLPKDAPDQVYLSLADIDPNPDQPRTIVDDEELEALAESMKSSGLLQPIGVRKAVTDNNKTVYTLIYGQRRLAAARLLGWEKIMALSFKGGPSDREIALVENLQRVDLNPLDTAESLLRLKEEHNYSQERLGEIIGKQQNTVSGFLRIATLPADVKTEYQTSATLRKTASMWLLIEIARGDTPDIQQKLWRAFSDGTAKTVMALKRLRESLSAEEKRNEPESDEEPLAPKSKSIAAVVRAVDRLTKTPVEEIDGDDYRFLVEIRKQLNQLIKAVNRQRSGVGGASETVNDELAESELA